MWVSCRLNFLRRVVYPMLLFISPLKNIKQYLFWFLSFRATLVNSSILVPTNPKNRVGRSEIKKNRK